MIKFGDLIGRVTSGVRSTFSSEPSLLFSVRGMTVNELLKIQQDGPEMFDLIRPLLLEYDHILMEKFFNNPDMAPGEIRKYFLHQFEYILHSTAAEISRRERDKK